MDTADNTLDKQFPQEEEIKPTFAMEPKKFLLWLFIVTIVMLFAAMTSAYLVRSTDGDWLKFDLPNRFLVSTGVIILSSVTMQWAFGAAKNNNRTMLLVALTGTIILGLIFLKLQVDGWGQLVDQKVFLGGRYSNPAGSFVYILSGLHGFHLITGLIYLLIVLYSSIRTQAGSLNLLQIEMCTTYWHFLDLLWIYLFVFLQVNN
ncbi:cytochrome c oxidase subunit 3 [Cytophaga hutchinsonii ATCC 33406]|jgi:cytochrome c oxidase subunit 3|nr:cytochrome c oxidase subunit 3 [Cytophaga hutchinsonii]SFX96595.1 cytochrome c oxidase subunit 3 [Cytophaga hutchinsonii ATCC 33406]